MTIYLNRLDQIDGTIKDITRYLDEETDILLMQELERTAFERVVEDVHLRCSNAGKFFSDLFAGMTATRRWQLLVEDYDAQGRMRILFRGTIDNTSIVSDFGFEWVEFDAFSINKTFWDQAKVLKILNPQPASETEARTTMTTLLKILKREIVPERFGGIMSGFDIDPLYASRPIRGWTTAYRDLGIIMYGDPAYYFYDPTWATGNEGRYRDLDPKTTVAELLFGFAQYYNAEFYIDPETLFFTMKRRGDVLNDVQTNIDDILLEDEAPEIQSVDEDKVDYIYGFIQLPTPAAPIYSSNKQEPGTIEPGVYSWVVTFIEEKSGIKVESPPSPAFKMQYKDDYDRFFLDAGHTAYVPGSVTFNIPTSSSSLVTGRNFYRGKYLSLDAFVADRVTYRLVTTINDNTTIQVRDGTPSLNLGPTLTTDQSTGRAWFAYDEETESWQTILQDNEGGLNEPQGKILDIFPKLRFVDAEDPSKIRDFNFIEAFAFFGRESDLGFFVSQWHDMFRTKRRIKLGAKGMNFRIGDSMVSQKKLFPNDLTADERMLVKKATINLSKEHSSLELVTI